MQTFKQFLCEGGIATKKYHTERATREDILVALKKVSEATGISISSLKSNLLGSTRVTLAGKKKDSGDIDIAVPISLYDQEEIHNKMMTAVDNRGTFNKGNKVGSYAVNTGDHTVQVDLMFVTNTKWARFSYHSSQGDGSEFPGAVRTILLITALSHKLEEGKDFVLKDKDQIIARAQRAFRLDRGLVRTFKLAKYNKTKQAFNKTLQKVTPDELNAHLRSLGKSVKYDSSADVIDDPDTAVKFIFGKNVSVEDVATAEGVVSQIRKLVNGKEILEDAKKRLEEAKLPVPF
jgi:hypothetical protein